MAYDEHAVYRLYDCQGGLLYVGVTSNPAARLFDHLRKQPWGRFVGRIDIERFHSRAVAERHEAQAIREQHPRFNVTDACSAHTPWHPDRNELVEVLEQIKLDSGWGMAEAWGHLNRGDIYAAQTCVERYRMMAASLR